MNTGDLDMAEVRTGSATFGITCGTSGAAIHYTTDGTTPSASSPTYSSKITTKKNVTVKAIGIKSGMLNSEVATTEIQVKLPTPTLSQSVDGNSGTISITNSSAFEDYEGVSFQIAKDSGSYSTATFPYTITGNGTYKVKAISAGENVDSDEATISVSTFKVATPVITVDA